MEDRFFSQLAAEISSRVIKGLQIQGCAGTPAAKARAPVYQRLLTIDQAAIFLGRTRSAVEHLIYRRELAVVRRGRRVHLDINSLNDFIERNKT
jgi:excisionase family DNA binding protein